MKEKIVVCRRGSGWGWWNVECEGRGRLWGEKMGMGSECSCGRRQRERQDEGEMLGREIGSMWADGVDVGVK